MSDFQRVSFSDKRSALRNVIESVTNSHGFNYVFYEEPKASFLSVNSRLERRDIQENSNGDVRHIDVFWEGPVDSLSFDIQELPGLERLGNLQMGIVDQFRVVIYHAVSYTGSGEIDNRQEFENLLGGYSPKGIFPTLREKEGIKDANSSGKTVLLSTETNVTLPPMPRPLEGTSKERAHYCDFTVFITDM